MKAKSKFDAFGALTKKQRNAVIMLAEPKTTQRSVAGKIAVSEATLSRWTREPNFQAAQAEWDGEMFRRLRSKAIKTMDTLLRAKSEMVRFNAASYILDKTHIDDVIDDAQTGGENLIADWEEDEDDEPSSTQDPPSAAD